MNLFDLVQEIAHQVEGDPSDKVWGYCCQMCDASVDDCDRYNHWCIGRTCRTAMRNNAGFAEQVADQLARVLEIADRMGHD